MQLKYLLEDVEKKECLNLNYNYDICDVTSELSDVRPGSAFIAVGGRNFDGHTAIEKAVEQGAICVVFDNDEYRFNTEHLGENVSAVRVSDSRKALSVMCSNINGNPSRKLSLIGVTGTNGKTTTCHMLRTVLSENGIRCGVIGTVEAQRENRRGVCVSEYTGYTTPRPEILQPILRRMVQNGCKYAVMEVSSQALAQERVYGMKFDLGVFTNLSVDHLDYHGDMLSYRASKLKLFAQSEQKLANCDSDYSAPFAASAKTYSIYGSSDFGAEYLSAGSLGSSYDFRYGTNRLPVELAVPGIFNVYNSLAALSSSVLLGIPAEDAVSAIRKFKGVCGRLEKVNTDAPFSVFIDFAHTPDGLLNLLVSVRTFVKGRIILVFGCGGNRDSSKRSEMGKIALQNADFSIVTSDNPRFESPEKIIADIVEGMSDKNKYTVEPDREAAIRLALSVAKKDDAVILAGKGHELYQEISGKKYPFDEREIINRYI